MGQATSTHGGSSAHSLIHDRNHDDHTAAIPDECLALILQRLSFDDRNACVLVCRRWLTVEAQNRRRLALNASTGVNLHLPAIFTRFDSITELTLRCHRNSVSINDHALILISQRCCRLATVKLRRCREVTAVGILSLSQNCNSLRKFSCKSCTFGAKGIELLLNNSPSLQHLSVERLRGGDGVELISAAVAGKLRSIKIKNLYSGYFFFTSLITKSKNLTVLKISSCYGSNWDGLLNCIARQKNLLTEIHLEKLYVTDSGLTAVSKFSNLQSFHLAKAPDCSDNGIITIAKNCKNLRKLHIDGCRSNRIGYLALTEISNNCVDLKKLTLVGISPNSNSLVAIARNCVKLENLAMCGSKEIGDEEILCVAENFRRLKKLRIKRCRITDRGIEGFEKGCPNLERIKVEKCRGVSRGVVEWLRGKRRSLVVDLCSDESEAMKVINAKIFAFLFIFTFYLLTLVRNYLI